MMQVQLRMFLCFWGLSPKTAPASTGIVSFGVMIKEHECVVLIEDLAADGLKAGDIGTVVHVHERGAGYEVEFMTLDGNTVSVVTLLPKQFRPVDVMSSQRIQILLDELCIGFGFCLPPEAQARLKKSPPTSVDDFAKAVFQAEGLDIGADVRLWRQVRDVVLKHFHAWDAV